MIGKKKYFSPQYPNSQYAEISHPSPSLPTTFAYRPLASGTLSTSVVLRKEIQFSEILHPFQHIYFGLLTCRTFASNI